MNAGSAGKQPQMRDIINPLIGMVQKMVDDNGIPKGMRQVLCERGINIINITNMTAPDMRKATMTHCNYSFRQLEDAIEPALDTVSVDL